MSKAVKLHETRSIKLEFVKHDYGYTATMEHENDPVVMLAAENHVSMGRVLGQAIAALFGSPHPV